jgi:glycosyltransferase involved in cell wall biosynthesis
LNFKGITTTPHIKISEADYLVNLSESEGNSCIINEALQMETPVLLTPFDSGFEQVEHGKNGYFIPFDLHDIDFDSIINNIPKLETYKDKTTVKDWLNFFNFALEDFKRNNKMVKVKVIARVKGHNIGDIVELTEERATLGIDKGLCEVYIEIPVKKATKKKTK